MPELNSRSSDETRLTGTGCVLTLLTTIIIVGLAVPIVQYRDPRSGQPLPRMVAIFVPFLIGGVFFGTATMLLRILGLRVSKPPLKTGDEGRGTEPSHMTSKSGSGDSDSNPAGLHVGPGKSYMLQFACPKCSKQLRIPKAQTGELGICPACLSSFPIPH